MQHFRKMFLFVTIVCLVTMAFGQTEYRNHMLVQVNTQSEAQLRALYTFQNQLDIIPGPSRETPHIAAYPEDLELLEQEGFPYEIIHENLEKFYAERLGDRLDGYGLYHTFDEIVAFLDQIHADHPTITTEKFSIGQSIEGRELWIMKISDNPDVDENEPEVFYTSLIHVREPISAEVVIYFMDYLTDNYGTHSDATDLVNNREMYFFLCANPDGYVYNEQTNPDGGGMWRKNRRYDSGTGCYGVDLNRNFCYSWGYDDNGSSPNPCSETYRGDSAFSEPETEAWHQFLETRNFVIGNWYHTYGNLVLYPWGTAGFEGNGLTEDNDIFEMIADSMAYFIHSVNGVWYSTGTAFQLLYSVNGGSFDCEYGEYGIFSLTTEVGSGSDGFWPPQSRIAPLVEENLPANLFMARIAGSLITEFTLSDPDVSPAYGTVDSTYTFSIIYKSKGNIEPTTTEVYVDDVVHTMTTTDYDYTDGSLFTYATTLAEGLHEYYFHFVGDTLTRRDPETGAYSGPFVGGTPVVCYDFETAQGWSVNVEGTDDATTGEWGRMDPEPTFDNGDPVQPGDDHTPDPGVICWVTDGRAGSSAGTYDIDGGKTTLYSPIWDLSSYDNALLEIWTWYTNDEGNNPGQDEFKIDISSNGGSNWVSILNTTASWEYWKDDYFSVEDFITLTNNIRLRITASDESPGSLVEAGIDDLCLYGLTTTAPEAPTELTILVEGYDLHLFWQPSFGATGYRIERAFEPFGTFAEVGTTGGETEFIHTNGAQSDSTAFYRVVATN